jgi:alpha 1,3-glucosidase
VSPYSVDPSSVNISPNQAVFTAAVKSSLYPDIKFGLEVRIQDDGVARVRMDEVGGLRKRYDEAAAWALISEPVVSKDITWTTGQKDTKAVYGDKKDIEVVVAHQPLRISLLRNGKEQVVINGQGLLHMEHFRNKIESATSTEEPEPEEGAEGGGETQTVLKVNNPRAWFEGDTEDALFEETFSSWTDSKPKGLSPSGGIFLLDIDTNSCRSRVTVSRYQLSKSRNCLRHSSARHAPCPSHNYRQRPNIHRSIPPIQRRRL